VASQGYGACPALDKQHFSQTIDSLSDDLTWFVMFAGLGKFLKDPRTV
jgi:hypothetical protein